MVQLHIIAGDKTWVAGVELVTASEPPTRKPGIWGRRPFGRRPQPPLRRDLFLNQAATVPIQARRASEGTGSATRSDQDCAQHSARAPTGSPRLQRTTDNQQMRIANRLAVESCIRSCIVGHYTRPILAILVILGALLCATSYDTYVPSRRLDDGITGETHHSCQIERTALAPPSILTLARASSATIGRTRRNRTNPRVSHQLDTLGHAEPRKMHRRGTCSPLDDRPRSRRLGRFHAWPSLPHHCYAWPLLL